MAPRKRIPDRASEAKSRRFNFDTVPHGYVQPKRVKRPPPQDDPRNAWDRPHLNVHPDLKPGHFVIWIAATDVEGHTSKTGPSACAWRIRGQRADIVEAWPARASESSEKKAYVAAAAGALDRLPAGSTAEMICREVYIVDAINGRVIDWYGKLFPWPGEKYPRRPYGLVWWHFLNARARVTSQRMTERSSLITARRPNKPNDDDDKIIDELKQKAWDFHRGSKD